MTPDHSSRNLFRYLALYLYNEYFLLVLRTFYMQAYLLYLFQQLQSYLKRIKPFECQEPITSDHYLITTFCMGLNKTAATSVQSTTCSYPIISGNLFFSYTKKANLHTPPLNQHQQPQIRVSCRCNRDRSM